MAGGSRIEVFTDAAWAVWAPLIEEVRPRGKTPPKELRRTIAAIFWRHRNGAKWRGIPPQLGPWWLAAQLFLRWAKRGVWERLLELVQRRGVALGMAFLDGTTDRPRRHRRPRPPEGGGGEKGDPIARSETCARRLAAPAAATAPRPA